MYDLVGDKCDPVVRGHLALIKVIVSSLSDVSVCCFSLFSVIAETEYLLGFGHTGLRGNCDGLYHYSDILNKVS